jgi:uncharacterized protein (TIGR02996 family)
MTTLDALLSAIIAAPDDDAPRLVLADVLEERGQVERASFIRLQIKMARCRMCHRKDGTERKDSYAEHCGRCVPGRRRERELLAAHAAAWLLPSPTPFPPVVIDAEQIGWGLREVTRLGDEYIPVTFRRGFPDTVHLRCASLTGGPCGCCDGRGTITNDPSAGSWAGEQCPACHGTGTLPGIAAQLGRWPLRVVRLTCREPLHAGGNGAGRRLVVGELRYLWVCSDRRDTTRRDGIPAVLFDLLDDEAPRYSHRMYESADLAHAALSAAAIEYCRQAAEAATAAR